MIRLVSCPKGYAADQDKTVSPKDTLRKVRERLTSLDIAVLAETRRIDTGRLDIPVFLSRCGEDALAVMPTRKQMGKGASVEQAEASALMELMERYGFFTFWERMPDVVEATWSEAENRFGPALMPLEEIARACHDTLAPAKTRRVLNLRSWLFFPVTRIADGQTVYAPLDLFKQLGEFNGSSAGNADAESILQGACELVERHTCCIIDETHPALPTITITDGDDPVLVALLEKFHKNGIDVLLKDFSLQMPVPTVAALAMDPATFPHSSEIVYTAGTATSPAKAAIRALTEVAQLAGDFASSACYEASGLPKYERPEETAWLRQGPVVPLSSLPDLETDDILAELRNLAKRLRDKDFALYSIATTNPDTQIPSHYSFVPGFRFRERDKNASLGLFVGRMIAEQEDTTTATAALAVLEEVYPGAHFVPFFHGLLAMRAGDHGAARTWFTKAAPLQPENDARALTSFYHGYTWTLDGDWEQARPFLEQAAALSPDMKEYRNLLGVCLFKLGKYDTAAEEFRNILTRLDKGSAVDLQNLGLCHKFLGEKEQAAHYLAAALEINPGLEAAARHLQELACS